MQGKSLTKLLDWARGSHKPRYVAKSSLGPVAVETMVQKPYLFLSDTASQMLYDIKKRKLDIDLARVLNSMSTAELTLPVTPTVIDGITVDKERLELCDRLAANLARRHKRESGRPGTYNDGTLGGILCCPWFKGDPKMVVNPDLREWACRANTWASSLIFDLRVNRHGMWH